MPVLGICNGFQVLCEAGLLPGALTRNATCTSATATRCCASRAPTPPGRRHYADGQRIVIPVKNGEGRYVGRRRRPRPARGRGPGGVPLRRRQPERQSSRDIAGVTSENGRVVGLMPHPEHAVEELTGPRTDGLGFFTSVLQAVVRA